MVIRDGLRAGAPTRRDFESQRGRAPCPPPSPKTTKKKRKKIDQNVQTSKKSILVT